MNGQPKYREDIQDYLDDRLGMRGRADIEAYLNATPDAAQHVIALKRQSEGLRQLGASILDEPVPDRLRAIVGQSAEQRRSNSGHWLRNRLPQVAAAMLIFIAGGGTGWWLHDSLKLLPAPVKSVLQSSSYALTFYGSDKGFPIGFSPDQSKELAHWIKQIFGTSVPYPDLSPINYRFTGGNILPGAGGETIFYLYSRSKGMHISVIAWASDEEPSDAPTIAEVGDFSASYWYSGDFGYAVLGKSADDGLGDVTHSIYKFYEDTAEAEGK